MSAPNPTNHQVLVPTTLKHAPPPAVVYRYLKEEEHAEDFVNGRVWVSTLENVRTAEAERTEDPGDGTLTYTVRRLDGDTSAERAAAIEQNFASCGINLRATFGPNAILEDVSVVQVLQAYVLCTTSERSQYMVDAFGEFCVEISNPYRYFEVLGDGIIQQVRLAENFASLFCKVNYNGRSHADDTPRREQLTGFDSVPELAHEKEERMLWYPRDRKADTGLMIDSAALRPFCKLVPNIKR